MLEVDVDEETAERAQRLRALLALEIDRIRHDLTKRKPFMMAVWARKRSREPFLETLFTRWRTLVAGDLTLLATESIALLDTFHGLIDDFRLYLQYTEDMPTTLSARFDHRMVAIGEAADAAIAALGGVPDRPDRGDGLGADDAPPAPPPPRDDPSPDAGGGPPAPGER